MQRALSLTRTAVTGVTALAMVCAALATAGAASGYSLGQPFGIRKATRGRSRTFSGEVPAPLFFAVCTYDRSTQITCTRKWTHN